MKKDFHEYANIFPMLPENELEDLASDIKKNGLNNPIKLYDGKILDGRNRYRACELSGATAKFETFDGDDPLTYVVSENLHRRHLTAGQKAAVVVDMEAVVALIEKEAKDRIVEAAKTTHSNQHKKVQAPQKIGEPATKHNNETSEKLAKMIGTNRQYVSDAKNIKAQAPDIHEKVKSGELNIPDAKILSKESLEDREEIFDKVETGGAKNIKEAKQQMKKEKYQKKVEEIKKQKTETYFENKLPNLILADPPWKYDFAKTKNREIENHYNTEKVSDMETHLPETEKDCILFLWATAPKLKEAFELINLWGFKYKTNAVWDKKKIGMGYWFRGQHEILMVATKGNVSPPLPDFRVSSFFSETRTEHSKKPECVYEWIEKAFGDKTKMEMYSREVRPGWLAWGNEV